jgi:hypothetical protein
MRLQSSSVKSLATTSFGLNAAAPSLQPLVGQHGNGRASGKPSLDSLVLLKPNRRLDHVPFSVPTRNAGRRVTVLPVSLFVFSLTGDSVRAQTPCADNTHAGRVSYDRIKH